MKTIYKYPIKVGENKVLLPKDTQILRFGLTNQGCFIWALVDAEAREFKNIDILVIATGWLLKEPIGLYIGTIITDDDYVWHAFQTSF